MKRVIKNLLFLSGFLAVVSSCHKITGSGPVVSETKNHSGFTGVDLALDADVSIIRDSVYRVELVAQRNILDVMRTHMNGSTLCIGLQPGAWIKASEPILVKLHMPVIDRLSVSGSGSIRSNNEWPGSDLDLNVSGSGKIDLASVIAQSIHANISGSGEVILHDGSATDLETRISGSGDISIMGLKASKVVTHTSGSGTTRIYATETLEAHISGSGDVYYKGNPEIESHISGSGKLIRVY